MTIPFNKPYMTGKELFYISQAHYEGWLAGDGRFSKLCHAELERQTNCKKALLTHSCTAALEMAAILADIGPGDEVIMPSYTFVSTANAFVLRGAKIVFVDVRPDTMNIDENKVEAAITPRTKAIVPVHYAGVSCEMDTLLEIARRHDLLVIEDAAQAYFSRYKDRPVGSLGHMATLSFHETKNVISGEGGALLVNDPRFVERAEIIREKGTNRSKFFRGEVDKYTWVDIGSSFLPSELIAAFLWAQLEDSRAITARRLNIWSTYHRNFAEAEEQGRLRRPRIPSDCVHNAHMYYVLAPDLPTRSRLIAELRKIDVRAVFHYVPLHSSPFGKQNCRTAGDMSVTDSLADRLVRMPFWLGIEDHVDTISQAVLKSL
jgi:dTDP-4-amino-4,6-dideoxygalactose transaminase